MSDKRTANQFRRFIVRPTLQALNLLSPAAENLVVGTAIHESGGFSFFEQWTGAGDQTLGPAIGLFQIEPATHDDLFDNFLIYRPSILNRLDIMLAEAPTRHEQLLSNLRYACAICRLIYFRRPEPLPAADDLPGLADYWKRFYNTPIGAGTPAQFVMSYREYN